jgi:phosphate-selective porin OprO/OprP
MSPVLGRWRSPLPPLAVVAFSALAALSEAGARADTASEIRALKAAMAQQAARLRQLEIKAAAQAKDAAEAKAAAKHATNVANAAHGKAGEHAPPPVFVSLKQGGLKIETEDGANMFRVGGRMHLDGGANTHPTLGTSGNAGIRRGRLELEGRFAHYWLWRLQYEFAGGAAAIGVPGGFRDIFVGFKHPALAFMPFTKEPVILQIGQMFEPFGLEKSTSSNFNDFVERAMAVDAFAPFRNIGAAAVVHGEKWTAKAGVFTTGPQQDPALRPAPGVPVPLGVPAAAGWVPTGGGNYLDLTGRLTYAPIKEEDKLLHFGGSVRWHRPNEAIASTEARVAAPGNNIRTESNILGENLIGTPDLSCGLVRGAAGKCIKDVVVYGAELAAAYGPLSVQAEYIGARYNRDPAALARANAFGAFAPGGASLDFSGYYVYGTWYLTGESRAAAYTVSDLNGAGFGQIKIKNPVSKGGFGALELAARFSAINLNSGPFQGSYYHNLIAVAPDAFLRGAIANAGVLGGREQNVTVGLNWYPEPGVRFMANWTRVVALSAPWNRAYLDGAHPNLFVMRAQYDF